MSLKTIFGWTADCFKSLVFDGAQLFSLVEFGRKDRENNQSAPSLGKAFGKESIIKLSDSWILCAVTLSAEWIRKGTTGVILKYDCYTNLEN